MLWGIFVLMWVFLCQQCHLTRDVCFCSSDLQFNVENHEQDMIGRMTTLLPAEKQQISRNILPRRDTFEVLYHLHFDNLCAGRVLGYISSVIFQACPWQYVLLAISMSSPGFEQTSRRTFVSGSLWDPQPS